MTARFIPSPYPGGRILLRAGDLDVGAIFPPIVAEEPWRWRLWQLQAWGDGIGIAKTELAAKNAMRAAWLDALRRAGLAEVDVEVTG